MSVLVRRSVAGLLMLLLAAGLGVGAATSATAAVPAKSYPACTAGLASEVTAAKGQAGSWARENAARKIGAKASLSQAAQAYRASARTAADATAYAAAKVAYKKEIALIASTAVFQKQLTKNALATAKKRYKACIAAGGTWPAY